MSTASDRALARLAAARLRLFNASQKREAAVMRRVRMDDRAAFDALNVEITAARAEVDAAIADVRAAADPPSPPGPPNPPPTDRDVALDAVLAARAALTKLEK
jgi:hypothetical protein